MLKTLFLFVQIDIKIVAITLVILLIFSIIIIFLHHKIFMAQRFLDNMLFGNVPSGLFVCIKDENLTIKQYNKHFLSTIGYTKKELLEYHNNKLINLISKDDLGVAFKSLYDQVNLNHTFDIKLRLIKKDGSYAWVSWKGTICKRNNKNYLNCVIVDITKNVFNEDKIKIDEERYRIIAESSDSVIFEHNLNDKTIFYTNKYKLKFGEEPITENYPECFLKKLHNEDVNKYLVEYSKILYGKPSGNIELRIKNSSDKYIWCNMRYTSIFNDIGIPIKVIGKIIDVDKVKKETENLKQANRIDSFTGLYNKTSILKLIEEYLTINDSRNHALFFIDIDNFKGINDNYGHLYGDKILYEISNTIKKQFRYTDLLGRIGGDEFLVFVKDYIDENFIKEKAQALCDSIKNIKIDDKNLKVSASVGITLYPKNGTMLSTLYKKSDLALYAAKNDGKNTYKLYSEELDKRQYLSSIKENEIKSNIENEKQNIADYVNTIFNISVEFNNNNNINNIINNVLSIYGKNYNAERVYIYEFLNNGENLLNTYNWNKDSTIKTDKIIAFTKQEYEKNFINDSKIFIKNINENNSKYDFYKAKSYLHCKIITNNNLKGFIGFDTENQHLITKEEVETIIFISKMLEKHLTRSIERA